MTWWKFWTWWPIRQKHTPYYYKIGLDIPFEERRSTSKREGPGPQIRSPQ